jgi:REP element-mobilizing transposase RayT
MPRAPRIHVEGGYYHVILRGNHREDIFFCPSDRDRFEELVAEVIERFRMRVHAYCWMTNHVHLLMQVSEAPLGRAMMRIASRYARATQKTRPTTGHLFERRYRAILIDADSYLLELIRYIHLNPVRARMVSDPDRYLWSSHHNYLGLRTSTWITTDVALSLFHKQENQARSAYQRFILGGIGQRSSKMKELATGRADEPRVLGDDQFMNNLKLHWRPRARVTMASLIESVCREFQVDTNEILRPCRSRRAAMIRSVIAHRAIHLRIGALSDAARHFNRSASTLCGTLEHYRKLKPELFGKPPDD